MAGSARPSYLPLPISLKSGIGHLKIFWEWSSFRNALHYNPNPLHRPPNCGLCTTPLYAPLGPSNWFSSQKGGIRRMRATLLILFPTTSAQGVPNSVTQKLSFSHAGESHTDNDHSNRNSNKRGRWKANSVPTGSLE